MDFLILKNPGEGVVTHLNSALDEIGSIFHFNPTSFPVVGLDTVIAGKIAESPDQPLHVIVDLEDPDIKAWDAPILSMLRTRVIAGQELPIGSSFVILTNAAKDVVDQSLSSATLASVVTLDLKTHTSQINPTTHQATLRTVAQTIENASKAVLEQGKSALINLQNPDAHEVKMAGRTSPDDFTTYPKG